MVVEDLENLLLLHHGDESKINENNEQLCTVLQLIIISTFNILCSNQLTCDHVPRVCFSGPYPWTRPLFCSCWSRMFSSFRGLGMKPISQPSFTNRPIHQSLLNFWGVIIKIHRKKGCFHHTVCRFQREEHNHIALDVVKSRYFINTHLRHPSCQIEERLRQH